MTFSELVDQHIGLSCRKQLALSDFLGRHSWQVDQGKGTIDFGKGPGVFSKRRVYPIQILGTEAEDSGTWLWAWANTQSNIPARLLNAADRIQAFGESHGIDALTIAEVPSSEYPGPLLASIGAGLADADCYYRGPYPGGAAFFLVYETPLRQAPPTPSVRVANVLMQVISAFPVNHRAMARAYLEAEGLRVVEKDSGWSATDESGRSLKIAFDEMGRIAEATTGGQGATR
jgi:hypothetical protein